jgi:hypothetical protein
MGNEATITLNGIINQMLEGELWASYGALPMREKALF